MLGVDDLQAFIDKHQIEGEILLMENPTPTVESAAKVLGVLPSQIVKSILFTVNGDPFFTILNGTDRVDRKVLANYFEVGRKKIKLADAQMVLEITGFPVGAMPPFGHRKPIQTLLDPKVSEFEVVFAGGGSGQALLKIAPNEIKKFSQATIISFRETSENE